MQTTNNLLIGVNITEKCNLGCTYCVKGGWPNTNRTMTMEMLDTIAALPKRGACITGGDPGMAKEETFHYIQNETARTILCTNLTLWTPEELDWLARRVEFDVSVPSLVEKEYRALTRADTFPALDRNLEYIPQNQRITVVAWPGRLAAVETTLEALVARGFSFIAVQARFGLRRGPEKDTLTEAVRQWSQRWRQLADIRLNTLDGEDNMPFTHTCNAGYGRLSVLVDGSIIACSCVPAPVLGTLGNIEAAVQAGKDYYLSFPYQERQCCKSALPALENEEKTDA